MSRLQRSTLGEILTALRPRGFNDAEIEVAFWTVQKDGYAVMQDVRLFLADRGPAPQSPLLDALTLSIDALQRLASEYEKSDNPDLARETRAIASAYSTRRDWLLRNTEQADGVLLPIEGKGRSNSAGVCPECRGDMGWSHVGQRPNASPFCWHCHNTRFTDELASVQVHPATRESYELLGIPVPEHLDPPATPALSRDQAPAEESEE